MKGMLQEKFKRMLESGIKDLDKKMKIEHSQHEQKQYCPFPNKPALFYIPYYKIPVIFIFKAIEIENPTVFKTTGANSVHVS